MIDNVDLPPGPDTSDASRCAAVLAENERLRERISILEGDQDQHLASLAARRAQVLRLQTAAEGARAALQHYARRENWQPVTAASGSRHGLWLPGGFIRDWPEALSGDGYTLAEEVLTALTAALAGGEERTP